MEISEDVLKIDKKLVTMKRGFCDHFLTKIKISNHLMETEIPIFRQVVVTIVLAESDTPIRLQIERSTLQS